MGGVLVVCWLLTGFLAVVAGLAGLGLVVGPFVDGAPAEAPRSVLVGGSLEASISRPGMLAPATGVEISLAKECVAVPDGVCVEPLPVFAFELEPFVPLPPPDVGFWVVALGAAVEFAVATAEA